MAKADQLNSSSIPTAPNELSRRRLRMPIDQEDRVCSTVPAE
jgi:hypothetical protein